MQLQPPTERVSGNRLGPLVVVGAVVLAVGVLVAKPWDAPAGSSVALASATPSAPTVRVTASPAPTPTDSPRPLPTPDIAPLGAIGTVSWAVVGDQPSVHCQYGRSVRGARHLARVVCQSASKTSSDLFACSSNSQARLRISRTSERGLSKEMSGG